MKRNAEKDDLGGEAKETRPVTTKTCTDVYMKKMIGAGMTNIVELNGSGMHGKNRSIDPNLPKSLTMQPVPELLEDEVTTTTEEATLGADIEQIQHSHFCSTDLSGNGALLCDFLLRASDLRMITKYDYDFLKISTVTKMPMPPTHSLC